MYSVQTKSQKHTTGGIPRWSPTLVLVARFSAYVWQSGRDAQFSLTYGRMCLLPSTLILTTQQNLQDTYAIVDDVRTGRRRCQPTGSSLLGSMSSSKAHTVALALRGFLSDYHARPKTCTEQVFPGLLRYFDHRLSSISSRSGPGWPCLIGVTRPAKP